MPVYLDHAATTPMLPAAIAAYAAAAAAVGNPSSIHGYGQNAKRMLEEAREQIAETLGCDPIEIVFTSGGTEAVNSAIKGLYWARNPSVSGAFAPARPRILIPGGEHHATIDAAQWLQQYQGAQITWLPLDRQGRVRLEAVATELDTDPESIALISMLWANNEVGTIQPVEEIAALAASCGVPLHVDAVATYGQLPIDFGQIRLDTGGGAAGLVAISVSAHKIGGPVGIGALVLSRRTAIAPLIHGGGQQRQVRSGTQDVAAAVSFAVAASAAAARLSDEAIRLRGLRDRVIDGVLKAVPGATLNGVRDGRLPGNAHFSFPGCEGDSLLFLLDVAGVAVSTGSACQAGIPEPSHVLHAMGRTDLQARGALRITLGHTSTPADVDAFLAALPEAFVRASRAGFADRVVTLP
ncbi:MAG: cysteine desulfurase family protein [Microbacteriaceae bacterium]